MSGFEHYDAELAELDHEIRHYAAVCGIDLTHAFEVESLLKRSNESWGDDKARQSLQGLIFLRMKLETEMIGEGMVVPALVDSARAE
jgi:hypothetical protein